MNKSTTAATYGAGNSSQMVKRELSGASTEDSKDCLKLIAVVRERRADERSLDYQSDDLNWRSR